MHFSTTFVASTVLAVASASTLTGQATFYGGNVAGGACSFSTYTLPAGLFGTALSDSNWDTSANCGACVSVTGPSGNKITAMIVDECPGCGENHLDLFPDAFAELASPSTGVITVDWEYVDCPISSPLEVHNKEGVSAYWFSMQVVNADQGVASLDVSTDGGKTWQPTTRTTYNFFEQSSGFGTTTVDVKITADDGNVVVIPNVNIASGASTTASGNFGSTGTPVTSSSTVAVVASSSSDPVAATTPVVETTTTIAPVASSSSIASAVLVSGASSGVPAAVFQEVSSSSLTSTSYTTLSSTTTIYKTITIPKSTSTSTSTPAYTSVSSVSLPAYVPTRSSSSALAFVTSSSVAPVVQVANATTALPSGASISVVTITMCQPTVLTSVFPVPYSTATVEPISASTAAGAASSYVANITMPAATATPSAIFTGSAPSMQVSGFLAVVAGFLALLI